MPSATEGPTVTLSFANNFWGKDDAGVGPLLDRMASAKQTNDELRSFYSARASIEDDYARKLLSLSKKSLGSHEMGSLKASLDTVRGEVESMGKQHANTAAQMKSELEEPLAAFAGGMKERRKIIQNTVEKLLKVKIQQTNTVNKTRDRYEQDCLRIKGYLAQGHMVMGQEERKNKAKLEKTQISLASSNAEYEAAVKALEDTTARWNREWKAAADKFQDLEEERLDFSKSSLWTFANLASTVCVSDDTSCEKIRLSLEKMDVENDIVHFISEKGTGQEIPDPPKYINFCRGDVDDHRSDVSEEDNYSVAQFPRSINPAFRTSSPQPSTYESHHDPNSALARDLGHREPVSPLHPEHNINIPSPNSQSPSGPPPQNIQPPAKPSQNGHPTALSHRNTRPAGMPRQNSYPHAVPAQATHPPPMTHQNTYPLATTHQNNYPSSMMHQNNHSSAITHQDNYPSPVAHQNSYPSTLTHQGNHPSSMAHENNHSSSITHQNSHPSAIAPQDPYPTQDRRTAHSTQQYDASQFSAVPHDPYPMDGMTMLCRTDGANSVVSHRQSSRYGGMKSSATTSNVSSRIEALNSTKNEDVPARYEVMNLVTKPNRSSMFDVTKPPATTSNIPQRIDGLNTTTSSNVSAPYDGMNSATSSNLSALDDNSEYSNPTSFSSQEPPSGKVSPIKPEPAVAESVVSDSVAAEPIMQPIAKFVAKPIATEPEKPVAAEPEKPVAVEPEKRMVKKKSGFFQNHSPFRRKSTKDISKDVRVSNRNTWSPVTSVGTSTSKFTSTGASAGASAGPSTGSSMGTSAGTSTGTSTGASTGASTLRRPQTYQLEKKNLITDRAASPAPDPIDANATLALNVGQNVFPVANTDKRHQSIDQGAQPSDEQDPIALALAELKGAADNKQSANRISADRYHGISTPVPDRTHERTQSQAQESLRERTVERPVERPAERPVERPIERTQERAQERTPLFTRPVPAPRAGSEAGAGSRGTPPPSYDTPVQRLGVPPPAVTSKAMQEASRKYTGQTRQMLSSSRPPSVYNSTPSRPATRQADVPRAASPAAPRSVSPRPGTRAETRPGTRQEARPGTRQETRQEIRRETRQEIRQETRQETRPGTRQEMRPDTRQGQRSASPNPPYAGSQHRSSPQPNMTPRRGSEQGYFQPSSPAGINSRTASPSPYRADYDRPVSRNSAMAVQLAPVGGEGSIYGSVRSRGSGGRPGTSSSYRPMSVYGDRDTGAQDSRQRSRSVADPSRQYTPEGRAILHYARALYMYQAAIPEELGFAKGDILAVLRHQDDGWWEAEIHSGNGAGQGGLVPSNYLQPC
ncbi:hypothetical protein F4680DRAFT_439617 [Xylaria scruposa]|nr:hypothetical protein F4680DRAFT_439617 [Xylaria scruposa]